MTNEHGGIRIDRDQDAPMAVAIWTTGVDGEIIGAGDTEAEALRDAMATLRGWDEGQTAQLIMDLLVLARGWTVLS